MKRITPHNCAGCTACAVACSKGAIQMQPDNMGFLYPTIDKDKCIDCGICEKICPFEQSNTPSKDFEKRAFMSKHKDIKEIETSRSGAAFIALSDWILEQGGVVYGACLDSDFQVVHKRATTKSERDAFKGSKYAQSALGETFWQVKKDLGNGLCVMFTGTPCQVAGLKSIITSSRLQERLYTMDIICHGVASPGIWTDYIQLIKKKNKEKLLNVSFRDKGVYGWSGLHKETFTFQDVGKKIYGFNYYQPFFLRKSCNVCPFSSMNRPGDITIGDFWGWEKIDPSFNEGDKGVSLIICNTTKGSLWHEQIAANMYSIECHIEDCMQPNLIHATPESLMRDKVEYEYCKHGGEFILRKYCYISTFNRICNKLKKVLHIS